MKLLKQHSSLLLSITARSLLVSLPKYAQLQHHRDFSMNDIHIFLCVTFCPFYSFSKDVYDRPWQFKSARKRSHYWGFYKDIFHEKSYVGGIGIVFWHERKNEAKLVCTVKPHLEGLAPSACLQTVQCEWQPLGLGLHLPSYISLLLPRTTALQS